MVVRNRTLRKLAKKRFKKNQLKKRYKKLMMASVPALCLTLGAHAQTNEIDQTYMGTALLGIRRDNGNLIRYDFSAPPGEELRTIDMIRDENGSPCLAIDASAYCPGFMNLFAFWTDPSDDLTKLIYVNIHTANSTVVGEFGNDSDQLGSGRVTGAVAFNSNTNGNSDGASDGGSDGASDGSSDGNSDSASDGHSDGGSDGASDGSSDGNSDSASDGHSDGGADSASDELSAQWTVYAVQMGVDADSDGGFDGASDGGSDGASDGGSDGASDGGSDGNSDGLSDGGSDGNSNGVSDGGSDGASDGGSDGNSDGLSDGNSDGDSDSASDGDDDYTARLIRVDHQTGHVDTVMHLSHPYDSLATHDGHTFYAMVGEDVYAIDTSNGTETYLSTLTNTNVLGLEFAGSTLMGFDINNDHTLPLDATTGLPLASPIDMGTEELGTIVFVPLDTEPGDTRYD